MPSVRTCLTWTLLVAALAARSADCAVISGHITDYGTNQPLSGAVINVVEAFPDPYFSGSTSTDGNGYYSIVAPPGNAQVTASYANYKAQTQAIPLSDSPVTRDFALGPAGTIGGSVRDAQSMHALDNELVLLLDAQTKSVLSRARTLADGTYSFAGLGVAQYGVCVSNADDNYIDACYDKLAIGADGKINFTPINVAVGQYVSGIDFSLQAGATLSGTLRDKYFNVPIANQQIDFSLFSAQQDLISTISLRTDANGRYALHGLAAGKYYLKAGAFYVYTNINGAYTPRLYGGGECATQQAQSSQCPFAGAALIDVPVGGIDSGNFDLFPSYVVTGKVTDAQTGLGIANVTIHGCDNPSFFSSAISSTATTDADGNYTLAHVVGMDTYIATIDAPGYINAVWQNGLAPSQNCQSARSAGGNALSFTAPDQVLTNIDFALPRGAAISGHLSASDAPNAAVSSSVTLYSNTQLVSTIQSDTNGNYVTVGVAPGTYYVAAYESNGADCQLYQNLPCRAGWTSTNPYTMLDLSTATPIVLTGNQIQPGIDLQLKVNIFHSGFE